jgi:hypothetical protein
MDAKWEEFSARVRSALEEQVEGSSEAFKALWSKRDDVAIMGADGALDQGWEDVSTGIEWAANIIRASERSLDNKVTVVGEDMALTVDIETVKKTFGDETRVVSLRCTQVYRLEDGEWRVILRHADEFAPKGPRLAEQPAGVGPPTPGGFPGGPPGGGPPR